MGDPGSGVELVRPRDVNGVRGISDSVLVLLGLGPGDDYHSSPGVPLVIARALDEDRVKVRFGRMPWIMPCRGSTTS